MTREQKILYDYLRATFDITAVVQLQYSGVITGSEFLTYAGTKLYLGYSVEFGLGGSPGNVVSNQYVDFYNAANALFFRGLNSFVYYNTATALAYYYVNNIICSNIWFSRFNRSSSATIEYIKFLGYRLTIA